MYISIGFITGVSLGFEFIEKHEFSEEFGYVFAVDLLIVRLIFDY